MGIRPEPLEGGGLSASVPAVPFFVYARASGYLGKRMGLFDPTDAPERIEAVLERAGALRGRVVHRGKPVAGAKVHVHTIPEGAPFSHFSENLFTRFGGTYWGGEAMEADAEGFFELYLHRGDDYTLHAEAEGFARAESRTYSVSAGESVDDIVLVLVAPSTIEGRVIVAEGVERVPLDPEQWGFVCSRCHRALRSPDPDDGIMHPDLHHLVAVRR